MTYADAPLTIFKILIATLALAGGVVWAFYAIKNHF